MLVTRLTGRSVSTLDGVNDAMTNMSRAWESLLNSNERLDDVLTADWLTNQIPNDPFF